MGADVFLIRAWIPGVENAIEDLSRIFAGEPFAVRSRLGEHLVFSLRQKVAADARLIRPEKEFPAIGSSTPSSDRFEAVPKTTWQWR